MSIVKPFLVYGMKDTRIEGLPLLMELLERGRQRNRGLLTISNHISTLDDPMMWGMMPFSTYFDTSKARWTLGAADIMFTNRFISPLFHHGQVIKTVRGDGIYQPAIDTAIDKLNNFQWIHIFPEGKINPPTGNNLKPNYELLRFKWGISRLVLEAEIEPIILPIWLKGFDSVMPESRPLPQKFIPRLNQSLSIKISEPINDYLSTNNKATDERHCRIKDLRKDYRALLKRYQDREGDLKKLHDDPEAKKIRIEVASFLRSQLWAARN